MWSTQSISHNTTQSHSFSRVNEAEEDVFLEFSCFFYDPMDVGNLISGSSAFSKSSLNIWKFSIHILLKPSLENFERYFANVWDECNCVVVWTFFGIAFLWNENWALPILWPLLNLWQRRQEYMMEKSQSLQYVVLEKLDSCTQKKNDIWTFPHIIYQKNKK